MSDTRIPAIKNQAWIGLGLFVLALWLAWQAGSKIVANDWRTMEIAVVGIAGCVVVPTILRNWRLGFYIFFVWMLFEDLVRKFMGNSAALFFGKDFLLALVYLSFYIQIRRGREKSFRPPFLIFLGFFFWLAVLQVFNDNSPSILYGLLGLKVYFYYVPVIYLGYALIRSDEDLRKFLVVNMWLAAVIASVGIVQSIVGNSFLNPAHLAPDLEELGNLEKVTPSGQIFNLPDSVFVSSGRFSGYLFIALVLGVGAAGYLLLYTKKGRKTVFLVIGLLCVATLLSGSRGAVVSALMSALVLCAGFVWGAPWRKGYRLNKAIRRSFIVAALGIAALLLTFPNQAGSRIAFYTETLSPDSSSYALGNRSWSYPVTNLLTVFEQPHWVMGNGTGTATLGIQYVAKLLEQRAPNVGVEEGFGSLIAEMGILAPILWILWAGVLLYYSWSVVRRVRKTRFFPVALAIWWYSFLLLFVFTYGSLTGYQNYLNNIYLWLFIGILFRLPSLLANPPVTAVGLTAPQNPNIRGNEILSERHSSI